MSTHYKAEKIVDHFGDGKAFDVDLQYIEEISPLGTGGALGLMARPQRPLLVINGDVLTDVDVLAMLTFHQEQDVDMIVAVHHHELQLPYGVVEGDGVRVTGLREKPRLTFVINAGIYLIQPSVYDLIPHGRPFNMTDLVQWVIEADRRVASFPVRSYWVDVGDHNEYARAHAEAQRRSGTV